MLYIRSTKTRCTSLKAKSFKVEQGRQPESEGAHKMLSIEFSASDGKNRRITFYGKEIEHLKNCIKATEMD